MAQPLLGVVSCRSQTWILGCCQIHHLLHNQSAQVSNHAAIGHEGLQQAWARYRSAATALVLSRHGLICCGSVQARHLGIPAAYWAVRLLKAPQNQLH